MKYLEDIAVGDRASFGHYEVTREEVLAFAHAYDPQPFHLDDAAAAKTYFGRLSALGLAHLRHDDEHAGGELEGRRGSGQPGLARRR